MQKEDEIAKREAEGYMCDISRFIIRYKHSLDCNVDDCALSDEEIAEGLDMPPDRITLSDRKRYHDDIHLRIQYEPVWIEHKQDWNSGDDADATDRDFMIYLNDVWPMIRIMGNMTSGGMVLSARIQYKSYDPWENLDISDEEHNNLMEFCRNAIGDYNF